MLYLPTDRTMPEAALLRAEAIAANPQWIAQEKKPGAAHSRGWIRSNPDWPGSIVSRAGCTNKVLGDGNDCDEFPNTRFVAGGRNGDPRAGVRLMAESDNRTEGGHLGRLLGCLDDNETFLVLPLLDMDRNATTRQLAAANQLPRLLMDMENAPTTFHVCPLG